MLYKKPNVRYVDMCKWIDEKTRDVESLTEKEILTMHIYLWHLVWMLSHKAKYFNQKKYYEDFSTYLANQLLVRLVCNPKVKAGKLQQVQYILPYIKNVIYGYKVQFEQENYGNTISDHTLEINPDLSNTLAGVTKSQIHNDNEVYLRLYFDSISKTIKHFLYTTCPFIRDKKLMKNIYISCLISITNSVTMTHKQQVDVTTLFSDPERQFIKLCTIMKENRDNCIKLYHVPKKYKDLVTVLVREIYAIIENDCREMYGYSYDVNNDLLEATVFSELNSKDPLIGGADI